MTTSILGPHADSDRPKLRAMLADELAGDPEAAMVRATIRTRHASHVAAPEYLERHRRVARRLAREIRQSFNRSQTTNSVKRETARAA